MYDISDLDKLIVGTTTTTPTTKMSKLYPGKSHLTCNCCPAFDRLAQPENTFRKLSQSLLPSYQNPRNQPSVTHSLLPLTN
jgi:hypothetical protein